MSVRHFFITSLCFLAAASVAGAQTNLLLNPSYESPGTEGAIPSLWTNDGAEGQYIETWGTVPHDGSWMIRKVFNWTTGEGGNHQTVQVVPSEVYSATCYVAIDGFDSNFVGGGRVGLDPTGGTDPAGGSIVWGSWVEPASPEVWLAATVSGVTATGSNMTVFCRGRITQNASTGQPPWAGYFLDAAELVGPDPFAPTPTATPIPLIGNLNLGFDDPYTGSFNNTIASTWNAWWIEAASSEAVNGYAMVKPVAFWRSPSGLLNEAQQIWRDSSSENIDTGLYAPAVIEAGVQFRLSCYFMKDTDDGTPGSASDRLVNIGYDFSHTGQPIGDRSPAAFPSVTWASELEGMGDHNPGLDANALGASAGFDEWFQISTDFVESTGSEITLFVEVMSAVPAALQEFFIDEMGISVASTAVEKEHWSLFR